MDFGLFLLLTGVLFLRPAEIVPELLGLPIYEAVIIVNLLVAFPSILGQVFGRTLGEQPLTLGVLGILAAVVLSHLAHFSLGAAQEVGTEFAKVVLFYLLLLGVINTPRRFGHYLTWLLGFTLAATALAVLQYHDRIELPALEPLQDRWTDRETGEERVIWRLRGTGIFNDPNDLSLMLVVSLALTAYRLTDPNRKLLRWLWLGPLGVYGYALTLTQSRGGFLALLAGLLALLVARWGWRKSLPLAALILPLLFVAFGGRQTSLDTSEGTGQSRIQLWAEGLSLFHAEPLFGIGRGEYAEQVGQVAHNSFIHAYVELGFFGGTLFLGTFLLAGAALRRLASRLGETADRELRRLRPYLLAALAAYAAGLLTLSRCYVVPTYLLLGLVAAYARVSLPRHAPPPVRLDERALTRLAAAGVLFVLLAEGYVRLFARWG